MTYRSTPAIVARNWIGPGGGRRRTVDVAKIVTETVGSMGPWLVVLEGELKPFDGIAIETLLETSEWEGRSVVTLDMRKLDGFAPGAEMALRFAAQVVCAKQAVFTVLYDPNGPAAEALDRSGVLADRQIDFAPGSPDRT